MLRAVGCGSCASQWRGIVVACALFLAPSTVRAADAAVLTSRTGAALESALTDLPAGLTLDDAQIHAQTVAMRLCPPSGPCIALELTRPDARCAGETTPAFCVQFASPQPVLAPGILRAVARVPRDVWSLPLAEHAPVPWRTHRPWLQLAVLLGVAALLALAATGPAGLLGAAVLAAAAYTLHTRLAADDRMWRDRQEFVSLYWEAVWWLAPGLLGVAFGLLARHRPTVRLRLCASVAGIALLPLIWRALSFGDAIPMAFTGVLAAIWTSDGRPGRGKRWALAAVAGTLGLACLEVAVRQLAPPPAVDDARRELLLQPPLQPETPLRADDDAPFTADGSILANFAEALFVPPGQFHGLRARTPSGPWVLHLGDSMIFGERLADADTATARWQQLLPDVQHVNAGVCGSSIDVQLVLLQRLLQAWPPPRAVVLHAYPGNDLGGMDQHLAFCDGQTPLEPPGRPLAVRCVTYKPETGLSRLRHAPLPLPLMRAATWSWLARRLAAVHAVAQASGSPRVDEDPAVRYLEIAEAMTHELAQRHIPFAIALMPMRRSVLPAAPPDATSLLATVSRLGVPLFDAQPLFDAEVQRRGEAGLYLLAPDIHLSAEGARLYADWLAPQLAPILAGPAAAH